MAKNSTNDRQLDEAYRATAYCVETPTGDLCVRVGVRNADLDRMLERYGVRTWAIVTADNPHSVRQTAPQNQAARARLAERVRRGGYRSLACVARADAGDWPEERGLLILAIAPETSIALAQEFDQAALLVGEHGGPPELVFC